MLSAFWRGRGVGMSTVVLLLTATFAAFARMQWHGEAPTRSAMSGGTPERFPVLHGNSLQSGAEPDLDASTAVIRKLIESDCTWGTERQSDAQCTIDDRRRQHRGLPHQESAVVRGLHRRAAAMCEESSSVHIR